MPGIFVSCPLLLNPVRTILYISCMVASDLSVCMAVVNFGYICYTSAHNVSLVSCSVISLRLTVQSSLTLSVQLTKHSGAIHTLHTCRTGNKSRALKNVTMGSHIH